MIKQLITLTFILFNTAILAKSPNLDTNIRNLNKVFNPVNEGDMGIFIEYKQDVESLWINIEIVVKKCDLSRATFYVHNDQIISHLEDGCYFPYKLDDFSSCLYQIFCDDTITTKYECKNKLNQELSEKLIRALIYHNIGYSYVTNDKRKIR